jgi:hypothetical protein
MHSDKLTLTLDANPHAHRAVSLGRGCLPSTFAPPVCLRAGRHPLLSGINNRHETRAGEHLELNVARGMRLNLRSRLNVTASRPHTLPKCVPSNRGTMQPSTILLQIFTKNISQHALNCNNIAPFKNIFQLLKDKKDINRLTQNFS